MKKVFDLRKKNIDEPYLMRMYQKATLSNNNIGLLGEFGLFGTTEWWDNISKGKIKSRIFTGVIVDLYIDGQDYAENAFELKLEDGSRIKESIMVNNPSDKKLFQKGKVASIKYVFDKRKIIDDKGCSTYSDIVTEIYIYDDIKNNV